MSCGSIFAGPPCICCRELFRRPLERSIPTFYGLGSPTRVRHGVRMYVRLRATVLRTRPVSVPYCRRYGHDDRAAPPIRPLYYSIFALSFPVVVGVGRQRKCDDHSGLRVCPPDVAAQIRPPDGRPVPRRAARTARIRGAQSPAWKPAGEFGILNDWVMSADEDESLRAATSASAQPGMQVVPQYGDNHGQGQC